jgi:hypothetical protein
LVFELHALQETLIEIEASIHVGGPDAAWPGILGRRIYVAKETQGSHRPPQVKEQA